MTDSTTEEERRIAVAVDEGEESVYALQWFLRNQISDNANYTLILIYVRPQLPRVLHVRLRVSVCGCGDRIHGQVRQRPGWFSVERAENICRSYRNIKVETKACRGDAKDAICAMVENVGAELLVMEAMDMASSKGHSLEA